jgi:RNA polymerase sigma factor (sigma-70 family)
VTVASVPERPRADESADQLSDREELWIALAAIPPRMRAVLVLRFYEDLSEAETAAVLDCSVGNVKSQTSRALAKLRKTMPERTLQC